MLGMILFSDSIAILQNFTGAALSSYISFKDVLIITHAGNTNYGCSMPHNNHRLSVQYRCKSSFFVNYAKNRIARYISTLVDVELG